MTTTMQRWLKALEAAQQAVTVAASIRLLTPAEAASARRRLTDERAWLTTVSTEAR